jgi:hypothetical protein
MRELGIQMIPAYSPEARGRSERSFATWQGRLPQELRLRGISTVEAANRFLEQTYVAEFNRRFQVPATQPGSAFLPLSGQNLDRIFSLHYERVVNRDNTIQFENRTLQIERVRWRATLFGCTVRVHQHLNGDLTLTHGQQTVASYPAPNTLALDTEMAVEKTCDGKVKVPTFPSHLEIPKTPRDSHFPAATKAAG